MSLPGKCACGRGRVIGVIPDPPLNSAEASRMSLDELIKTRAVCQDCYREACDKYAREGRP